MFEASLGGLCKYRLIRRKMVWQFSVLVDKEQSSGCAWERSPEKCAKEVKNPGVEALRTVIFCNVVGAQLNS